MEREVVICAGELTGSSRLLGLDRMEELGTQDGQVLHPIVRARRPHRATGLPHSSRGPLPPPQDQSMAPGHSGPLAGMSGNSLGGWPEPDHFLFKVLPCLAPGANESKIVMCSPVRESYLGAPRVYYSANLIGDEGGPTPVLSYLTHGHFPTVMRLGTRGRLSFTQK